MTDLQTGIARLSTSRAVIELADGYLHWDDAAQSWWHVDVHDVEAAGAMEPWDYSVWCAESGAAEATREQLIEAGEEVEPLPVVEVIGVDEAQADWTDEDLPILTLTLRVTIGDQVSGGSAMFCRDEINGGWQHVGDSIDCWLQLDEWDADVVSTIVRQLTSGASVGTRYEVRS